VDGVTSTVILRRALELLGADVTHFIPERIRDGYGLQPASLDRLHAAGVRLVISVDCGIRGVEAALHARALGLDLIITGPPRTGHGAPGRIRGHQSEATRLQLSGQEPRRRRRGAEVVQALCGRANKGHWLPAFVKVAAIGRSPTSCRSSARTGSSPSSGLEMLSKGPHKIGLRALLDVCGLTGKEIDSYHIGFVLAPRVNAAGRMSTPDIAARLLLAADEAMSAEARELAEQLNSENLRRQQEEARSSRRRARRLKRISTSARAQSSSSLVKAGIAASSASSPPSWSTHSIGRRSCCRRTGRCARVVPQHPVIQHAGRTRIVRRRAGQIRRTQAGGRPHDGDRAHP
jgi:single-stranded-DNA-specific exonuclease